MARRPAWAWRRCFCWRPGAVATFILSGVRMRAYAHLGAGAFELEYGVAGVVRERRAAYEPVFARRIALGVALCILSVLPLILGGHAGRAGVRDARACVASACMGGRGRIRHRMRVHRPRAASTACCARADFRAEAVEDERRVERIAGVYGPR